MLFHLQACGLAQIDSIWPYHFADKLNAMSRRDDSRLVIQLQAKMGTQILIDGADGIPYLLLDGARMIISSM